MLINSLKKIFFKEKLKKKCVKNIVENIIQVSQSDIFYKKYKIEKDFILRFEIIIILVFLIFFRLKNNKKFRPKLQEIYDYLFDYIDFSLREIGTGDLGVGKKVKILAKTFSFRIKTYNKSFQINFDNIKKPIKKYLFKKNTNPIIVNKFVKYILDENRRIHSNITKNIFVKNLFKLPK
tara:strand:- start:1436 stop:1972 length:537 start_codon:yes stop_codon:yes gene_type:complete